MASSSIAISITINQRQISQPQARYEATITNKAHSSYVALICSIVVATWFSLCTKLVDRYSLRHRSTYLSLTLTLPTLLHPLQTRISERIITLYNERSKTQYRGAPASK